MRPRCWTRAGLAGAAAGLLSASAEAQLVRPTSRRPPPATTVTAAVNVADARPGDLRGHFGVPLAERLLASPKGELGKRRRGLVRLASIGTPQAIELLVRTWETPEDPLNRDGRSRLEIVRAVAPLAKERGIRELLQRLVAVEPADDFTALASASAALALAASGEPEASDFLVALAREGEATSELARRALAQHPPKILPSALGPRAVATAPLVRLAAALGDVRAIPFLRAAVRGGEPSVRTAALVALGELGDGEAVPIARGWSSEIEPAPRAAALRVLSSLAPGESVPGLSRALSDPTSRNDALALAEIVADDRLLPPLLILAADRDPDVRRSAVPALGRLLDDRAVRALEAQLGDRATALAAAAALAASPSPTAGSAIERALRSPQRRLAAVHAALARKLLRQGAFPGLVPVVEELARGDLEDRATAAFARACLGTSPTESELGDRAQLSSVARGLLARGDLRALAPLLARDEVDEAAAVALLDDEVAASVPSARLLHWAESGAAHAPLAAKVLATRDEEATRLQLDRLFTSPDLAVRAHVAWGLGHSPRPDAASRLAGAYEQETHASVRRALVGSLASRRGIPVADRALALAGTLDPDDRTRALATAARYGTVRAPLGRTAGGTHTAFVQIEGGAPLAAFRFELPSGLVIPVRADSGGALVVPGLPAGPSQVSLAATPGRREERP